MQAFSRYDQKGKFCLAHLFTFQTFKTRSSVILGLAYIASPRLRSPGGICSIGANFFINMGQTYFWATNQKLCIYGALSVINVSCTSVLNLHFKN